VLKYIDSGERKQQNTCLKLSECERSWSSNPHQELIKKEGPRTDMMKHVEETAEESRKPITERSRLKKLCKSMDEKLNVCPLQRNVQLGSNELEYSATSQVSMLVRSMLSIAWYWVERFSSFTSVKTAARFELRKENTFAARSLVDKKDVLSQGYS